jgi:Phytanoyl-CoA dioxygenase (PhyH)
MTETVRHPQPVDAALARRGYAVLRRLVPRAAIDAALRHIHLDILQRGLPTDTIGPWLWSSHWFPHLKWDAPILALTEQLPDELRAGELCDPQILLHWPDSGLDEPLVSHVDAEPAWADGRRYRRIVGVALTPAHARNGGLVVWPFDSDEQTPLELDAGDVVVLHPQLPHSSGLNREGAIRYAVYFRYLEPRPEP